MWVWILSQMHPLPIFPFLKGSWQTDLKGGWSQRVSGGHLYILEAPQSADWNISPGHNLLSALHMFLYCIHMFWCIKKSHFMIWFEGPWRWRKRNWADWLQHGTFSCDKDNGYKCVLGIERLFTMGMTMMRGKQMNLDSQPVTMKASWLAPEMLWNHLKLD